MKADAARDHRFARLIDRTTIAFQRPIAAEPERVWEAVSTAEGISSWFTPTTLDACLGGRFSFEGAWDGVVSIYDPPSAIEFLADAGGRTRFEIVPADSGILLTLVDVMAPGLEVPAHVFENEGAASAHQPGGPGTHWAGLIAGWHQHLDAMEQGLTAKSDSISFEDLIAHYVAMTSQT